MDLPETKCQCPMGSVMKCDRDLTQEDLLCDKCREVHKPLFPAGLGLPSDERIPYPSDRPEPTSAMPAPMPATVKQAFERYREERINYLGRERYY